MIDKILFRCNRTFSNNFFRELNHHLFPSENLSVMGIQGCFIYFDFFGNLFISMLSKDTLYIVDNYRFFLKNGLNILL